MSEDKRICPNCIKESHLSATISASGTVANCDYCDTTQLTTDLASLADRCEHVIETYFEPTSLVDAVVIYDRSPMGESLKDVLLNLLGAVDDEVAEDLAEVLGDRWVDWDTQEHQYGEDPHFSERSRLFSSFSAEWRKMEDSLRSEARIVNPKVNAILGKIFGPLLNYRTASGNDVMVHAGPGTNLSKLYRARVFQSLEGLEAALSHPAREVGPPSSEVARAGRMNARGVSVFYGATTPEIAVSEVRPPVGSHVLLGTFNIVRSLKILDLEKLEDLILHPGASLFDERTEEIAGRNDFLRSLSSRIVMPVMPENEDYGYLITQAIADFLATHPDLNLDGILFRSVQYQGPGGHQGRNVVLFNKASRVASSQEGESPTSHVQLLEADEDGEHWSPEIHVIHPEDLPQVPYWFTDSDERTVALEIDLADLEIQEVKGVNFTTNKTQVTKYSNLKQDATSDAFPHFRRNNRKWHR